MSLPPSSPENSSPRASELDRYDYELPRHLIAQAPVERRSDARLLVVDRRRESLEHRRVSDLPDILRRGDCLVINDTRVVPAKLIGRRTTGGAWEALFLEIDAGTGAWHIICRKSSKLHAGEVITLVSPQGQEDIRLQLLARKGRGQWLAQPQSAEDVFTILERVGRVPLPPYIRRKMVESDHRRYQTVYAQTAGAVAAPTAGLHFTMELLQQLADRGVEVCRLTLHVGPGTFRPITAKRLAEHRMHAEWGSISSESISQILRCRETGGRVVAVGTTCVRLLETAAAEGQLRPFSGYTELFIHPPYEFRIVDALMTNFHLPRTTLLVLVCTFGGEELIRRAYEEAIREQYRFYSYGDAMLIL